MQSARLYRFLIRVETHSSDRRFKMSPLRPTRDFCSSWTAFFKKLISCGVMAEAGGGASRTAMKGYRQNVSAAFLT